MALHTHPVKLIFISLISSKMFKNDKEDDIEEKGNDMFHLYVMNDRHIYVWHFFHEILNISAGHNNSLSIFKI